MNKLVPWLPVPADKQAHFFVGAALGAIAYLAAGSYASPRPMLWAFAAGFLAGLGKELYDSRQPGNRFDPADLFATMAGSAFGGAMFALGVVLFR